MIVMWMIVMNNNLVNMKCTEKSDTAVITFVDDYLTTQINQDLNGYYLCCKQ